MAINKVTFNHVQFWEEIGATLVDAPEYPIPAEVKELVKIKGANGTLTEATGYFNNIELDLHFRCLTNFASNPKYKNFNELKRFINKTFNNITDNRLQFEDNPNKYYKVKTVEVGAITKLSDYEIDFNVNFICDPFLYSTQDEIIRNFGAITYNGDVNNAPIIKFTCGSSARYTINCNGRTLEFTGRQGKTVEINNNPYSIVVVDGAPVESTGTPPILIANTTNNITLSGGGWTNTQIYKNERYLG